MLELKVIREDFSVCRLGDLTQVDLTEEYYFIGKTDEELSLVCRTCRVPGNAVSREDGWKAGFFIDRDPGKDILHSGGGEDRHLCGVHL